MTYQEQTLEAIARKVIKDYDPTLLDEPREIPIEDVIEKLFGLSIEYQYIRNNGRILGETIFDDTWIPVYDMDEKKYKWIFVKRGTIIIDASLLDCHKDGRLRFTCGHELAHWICHQEIYSGSGKTAAMTKAKKSSEDDASIERQADIISSALLMPIGQVKIAFYRNARVTNDPIEYLAKLFNVSKQAMDIRLKNIHLILKFI